MKDKLSEHQKTISILSQQKEAQIKLYKTREEKELDKFIRVIPTASVSRPQLKSNLMEDRVMHNNSQGKKQEVEDQCSRGTDLYLITLQDTNSPNPICLMAKATSSQAWLWHRRLSHLNFNTINLFSKNDIVVGLSKLKLIKDHLCSSCDLGKAK
nr:integrase, catalytic region, zinc finger, CCHC-type, peptidase aspartic, catalytic [Tanacetum cinerariifolium]